LIQLLYFYPKDNKEASLRRYSLRVSKRKC